MSMAMSLFGKVENWISLRFHFAAGFRVVPGQKPGHQPHCAGQYRKI
jgi:hypothetical protein